MSPARNFLARPLFVVKGDTLVFRTELEACHERIDELTSVLAEMVGVYWGDGDGDPPACIQRAMTALSEDVRS